MAIKQLNEETAIDLLEGEIILFSNFPNIRVYYWGKKLPSASKVNFVITNKRIALIPYKKGKEEVNINFEDIYYTSPAYSTILNNPNYGSSESTSGKFTPFVIIIKPEEGAGFFKRTFFKGKHKFAIYPPVKTMIKNDLMDMGAALKKEMFNLLKQAELHQVHHNEHLTYDEKRDAASKIIMEYAGYTYKKAEAHNRGEHFTARNIIVELVSAGMNAYSENPVPFDEGAASKYPNETSTGAASSPVPDVASPKTPSVSSPAEFAQKKFFSPGAIIGAVVLGIILTPLLGIIGLIIGVAGGWFCGKWAWEKYIVPKLNK